MNSCKVLPLLIGDEKLAYKGQKSRWGETQHKKSQKNIVVGVCQKI